MELPINYTNSHWTVRKQARLRYIKLQGGLCHHCGKPLKGNPSEEVMNAKINRRLFPKHFFDNPIHLHHCHNTHMSLGAVHARCNAYLWEYLGE